MKHRINILGASGCGATTTGKSLAAALGVPHFECDDYYHEPTDPPFEKQRPPLERCRLIVADLARAASWVLSGGVAGWEPYPQLEFTLVVFLWLPADARLERLRHRERERFGRRILESGDMHASHEAFIEWAAHYDRGDVEGKTLALHEAYQATQICPVLHIRHLATTEEIRQTILAALGSSGR